ncbi:MAG: DUF4410 domain-containing protein [Candidatus Brocadia sp.]|nr:DUF4410 domain-containing protein [Candidatus Brocadia sp.]
MKSFKVMTLLISIFFVITFKFAVAETITNETIVTMVKAGLGEELISSKIKTSQNQFDVSTESILKLKKEGVSEKIIKIMLDASIKLDTPEQKTVPIVNPAESSNLGEKAPHVEKEQKESGATTATVEHREENIYLLKLDVVDRTSGQSLTKEQLLTIRNEIIKQIKDKYPNVKIANEEIEKRSATLRVFVDVFTAGNRALRFWVGFGAGKAHMRMTADWLEGNYSLVKDSEVYQRFGAASLRSGQSIEIQMTQLIGQYSVQFISRHINQ